MNFIFISYYINSNSLLKIKKIFNKGIKININLNIYDL